jgi:hypothetical protein
MDTGYSESTRRMHNHNSVLVGPFAHARYLLYSPEGNDIPCTITSFPLKLSSQCVSKCCYNDFPGDFEGFNW